MAGLRKGRVKVFGRTRARACEEKIRMVPFPSPSPLPPLSISIIFLSLSKACHVAQGKDSKRLESLSARLIAKKISEHLKLEYIRDVDVPGRWRRHNQVTQIQKLSFYTLFYCVFVVMYFFNINFFDRNTAP